MQLNRISKSKHRWYFILLLVIASILPGGESRAQSKQVNASVEMLVNGNFAQGLVHWDTYQGNGARSQVDCANDGPGGAAALRLKVLETSDFPWRLQVYQKVTRIEKGKSYLLKFWVRSDRAANLTVNCMQNHPPSGHVQKKMPISTEWEQKQFNFDGPWADDTLRITFTDLGTNTGQVYWFADCTLTAVPGAKPQTVWDGETASKGSGWANPASTCTIAAQKAEAHSGNTAVEFRFKGDGKSGWLGCGWDWAEFKVGAYGTDITAMKNFSFWLKVKGQVADFSFNLLCNGEPALDQPQHHTEKVMVSNYCPDWKDGDWHQIVLPLKDLVQPAGFDATHVAEMQFFNTGAGDGSFFIDDLTFD